MPTAENAEWRRWCIFAIANSTQLRVMRATAKTGEMLSGRCERGERGERGKRGERGVVRAASAASDESRESRAEEGGSEGRKGDGLEEC